MRKRCLILLNLHWRPLRKRHVPHPIVSGPEACGRRWASTAASDAYGERVPTANASAIGQIGIPLARSSSMHCATYHRAPYVDASGDFEAVGRERTVGVALGS
jgi:hypothetical protein